MAFSNKQKQNRPKPSLKPVSTRPRDATPSGEDVTTPAPTTPTAKEFRIPERLPCPPAPRKRRPVSMTAGFCHHAGAREFFVPPDLETVFKYHLERAK